MTASKRNASVDVFRLAASLLVVAVHITPFTEFGRALPDLVLTFSKIAVPFFFAVMGYYYVTKLESGKKCFWNTTVNLLVPYLFWSAFYYASDFFLHYIGTTSPLNYLKSCTVDFLLNGGHYHLWFFRAAIISVIFATLFYKIRALKALAWLSLPLLAVGIIGCAYPDFGSGIPFVREIIRLEYFLHIRRIFLMGLPFFMQGYFINRLRRRGEGAKTKTLCLVTAAVFLLYLAENAYIILSGAGNNCPLTAALYPLLFLIILLLLDNPMKRSGRFVQSAKSVSGFVYFSHPFIIELVTAALGIFNADGLKTVGYFVTASAAVAAGYALSRVNNKYVRLLCG